MKSDEIRAKEGANQQPARTTAWTPGKLIERNSERGMAAILGIFL